MIQAIETIYNGYKFRSRLEARHAVFFDSLGLRYEYEPEGFVLEDGTHYLPDFYLPELDGSLQGGVWLEVKPKEPEGAEAAKAQGLTWRGEPVVVSWGFPLEPALTSIHLLAFCPNNRQYAYWAECRKCGRIGVSALSGSPQPCLCRFTEGDPTRLYSLASPRLVIAYTAARQARFEHGETPRGPKETPARAPQRHLAPTTSLTSPRIVTPSARHCPFVVGDHLIHRKFGEGSVIGVKRLSDDFDVTIKFADGVIRTLSAEFMANAVARP